MIYVYFSYKGDEDALALSVAQLRRVDAEAMVFVANDKEARARVPEGCREVITAYDRGGTGKGLAAVRGELEVFRYLMEVAQVDEVVKVDCDVWVRDVKPVVEVAGDFVGVEGARALTPMGCFYKISRLAVCFCLEYMERRTRWQAGAYAEAITLWHLLALSRLPLVLVEAGSGVLSGFGLADGGHGMAPAVLNAALVHCGEPVRVGGELVRAGRELTLTRMALLASVDKGAEVV